MTAKSILDIRSHVSFSNFSVHMDQIGMKTGMSSEFIRLNYTNSVISDLETNSKTFI